MKETGKILMLCLLMMIAACGKEEIGVGKRPAADGGWRNPSFSIDTTENARKRCYVTGLDYQDGYDWRPDTEKGTVKCSLVVFADGVPAMKVAVGDEYLVSPDPDMHRVIKGHLYTDFSTDDETVIKKDGREIFRYAGREMILGMSVSDGDVYTLGKPRSGDGFSFRKNGEAVLERSSGSPFPRLQDTDGVISFAFSEMIQDADDMIERYYQYADGDVRQIAVREDVRKVWDVMMHEGRTCYLADMVGISVPVLVSGSGMKTMELTSGMRLVTCRLIPAGKSVIVEAIYSSNGTFLSSGLWKDGARHMLFGAGMTVGGICTSDDGVSCVLNSKYSGGGGTIFRCGETFTMPQGYICMGSNPLAMMDGILHVGLTSVRGGKPVIWMDGKTQELDINGCVCTLTVQ